jgi:hypothetical protein
VFAAGGEKLPEPAVSSPPSGRFPFDAGANIFPLTTVLYGTNSSHKRYQMVPLVMV